MLQECRILRLGMTRDVEPPREHASDDGLLLGIEFRQRVEADLDG